MSDQCSRCGTTLRVVIVQEPVEREELVRPDLGLDGYEMVKTFERREELADCPRCTGSF